MYNFLESLTTDNRKIISKLFRTILVPVWYILEKLCYRKYWKRIILQELIENEEIFNFLDKNEFAIEKGRLVKLDVVEDIEFLHGRTDKEIEDIIRHEYIDALTKLLETISFDIGNYLVLDVEVKKEFQTIDGKNYKVDVFYVYLQFNRYYWMQLAKKKLWRWLSIVFIILLIIGIISYLY